MTSAAPLDDSLQPEYFEAVYAAASDPWSFETSDYEREKYAATLAALPRTHYARAFEIGCSIGVLTAALAPLCDELLAVDVNENALQSARRRLASLANVTLERKFLPQEFPDGLFDLVLLSEVGYYWSREVLADAAARMVRSLMPGATLLLVHWTPRVHDYPLTGDEVHDHFQSLASPEGALSHLRHDRRATYRLDVYERRAD